MSIRHAVWITLPPAHAGDTVWKVKQQEQGDAGEQELRLDERVCEWQHSEQGLIMVADGRIGAAGTDRSLIQDAVGTSVTGRAKLIVSG